MTARYWAGVVSSLAVVACLYAYGVGYERGAAETYRVRTDTLRLTIARLDTVYQRDTLVLWRTKRIIDTLVRVESIPAIARDSARADTALRVTLAGLSACSAALTTCEARVAAERQLRVAAESALAERASRRPPVLALSLGALAGLLTALLLGR